MASHNQLCGEILNFTRGAREQLDQVDALVEQVQLAHAGELAKARPYTIVSDTEGKHLFVGGEHERVHIKGCFADCWKRPDLVRDSIVEGQRKATLDQWRAMGHPTGEPAHPDVLHLLSPLDHTVIVYDLDTRRDNEAQPMMLNSKGKMSGVIDGWRSITRAALKGDAAHSHINSRCEDLTFRNGYFLGGGLDFAFGDRREGTTLLEDSPAGGLVFENYGFQYLTISEGPAQLGLIALMRICRFVNCWTLNRWPMAMKGGKPKYGAILPPGVELVQQVPQDWREDVLAGGMEF